MGLMRYQPPGLTRLAASPLRRGLVSYIPLSSPSRGDIVDGVAWTSGGTTAMDVAPRGTGLRVKAVNNAYVSRPIASVIGTGTAQPVSFRYRLYLHAVPTTSLMSWGSTPQDGTPRYYARLSSVGGGTLNFFFSGSYHYAAPVQIEREYIVTHTFDGSLHSTYLNGVLVGTSGGAWTGNAANLYLGIGFDGVLSTSDFLISDFALWNRSLSAQEVVSDAQNPWQLFADPYEDDEIVVAAAPTGLALSPSAGSISVQGYAPSVMQMTAASISPVSGALNIVSYAPTIQRTESATPTAGLFALSGYAPNVTRTTNAVADTQIISGSLNPAVTISGYAPGIARTANQSVAYALTLMAFTGYAPAIVQHGPVIELSYRLYPLKSDKYSTVHLSS